MPHKNITLLGASGHLGPFILSALLSATPSFNITVLVRSTSKATIAEGPTIKTLPDEPSVSNLVPLLHGQDALVCALPGSNKDLQCKLADAAFEAGVKLFVPADFGSCDSSDPLVLERLDLYRSKAEVRDYLKNLVEVKGKQAPEGKGREFGWCSLVCGHFFDLGLECDLLGLDLRGKREAKLFDGGKEKFSASTRERIAEATVRILQVDGEGEGRKREEVRNRLVYVQSFAVSQREIMNAVDKVTATKGKWQVDDIESEPLMAELKERLERTGDPDLREELVAVMGMTNSDWRKRKGFAMEALGLEDESLEEVVKRVLKK